MQTVLSFLLTLSFNHPSKSTDVTNVCGHNCFSLCILEDHYRMKIAALNDNRKKMEDLEKDVKNLVVFFGDLKIPKFNSEIN